MKKQDSNTEQCIIGEKLLKISHVSIHYAQLRGKSFFTDEEKDSIAQYIRLEKAIKGSCFIDKDGIEILTKAYLK